MDTYATTTPHRRLYHHGSWQTFIVQHLKSQSDPSRNLHSDEKKPFLVRKFKLLFKNTLLVVVKKTDTE